MAETALVVSIIAALVSVGSVAAALWQARMNARAISAEEADRREQLDLLRQQVESEASIRESEGAAKIVVERGGWSRTSGRTEFEFFAQARALDCCR